MDADIAQRSVYRIVGFLREEISLGQFSPYQFV
jgi:hypothetical protein